MILISLAPEKPYPCERERLWLENSAGVWGKKMSWIAILQISKGCEKQDDDVNLKL